MSADLWSGLAPLFGILGLLIGFGAFVFAYNRDWRWKWLFVPAVAVAYGAIILVVGMLVVT